MVQYFNFYYFVYAAAALSFVSGLYLSLRKKSEKTIKIVLFCILFANFALHFLKLAFSPYREGLPETVRKSTFENICAVSTLLFPWFFISKNKTLKDYMFYLGLLGGVLALFIPTEALGKDAFIFDTVRFYFCHTVLWAVPLIMVMLKIHSLDYRRVFKAPFIFYLVLVIILVNEVVLMGAGFVEKDLNLFFDTDHRNSSFIFGPTDEFKNIVPMLTALTPKLFLTVPFGPNAGEVFYWPVLWLAVPAYIYICSLGFIMALPFEYKHVKSDISALREKITIFKTKIFKRGGGK